MTGVLLDFSAIATVIRQHFCTCRLHANVAGNRSAKLLLERWTGANGSFGRVEAMFPRDTGEVSISTIGR